MSFISSPNSFNWIDTICIKAIMGPLINSSCKQSPYASVTGLQRPGLLPHTSYLHEDERLLYVKPNHSSRLPWPGHRNQSGPSLGCKTCSWLSWQLPEDAEAIQTDGDEVARTDKYGPKLASK